MQISDWDVQAGYRASQISRRTRGLSQRKVHRIMDYSLVPLPKFALGDHRKWFSLSDLSICLGLRDARGSLIAHEPSGSMVPQLRRFIADERGQDTIEYMLLASFIAILGILGAQAIGVEINTSYRSWDSATQNIWEVDDPLPTP